MTGTGPLIERVLLTNDDGIDAPGLAVLEEVAQSIAREVWVVAPEHDQSGTSHSISLHEPLRFSLRSERRFGVLGTPADCVVMALGRLMKETPPGLILSGINRGSNLGIETVFSGTVGAAMTGMLLGIPSMALSQAFTGQSPVKWETARALAPGAIRRLLAAGWHRQACLNINFPDLPPEQTGPLTPSRQGVGLVEGIDVAPRTDPRGLPYHWLQFRRIARGDAPGTETAVVQQGRISVTPLRFERTCDEALEKLILDWDA